MDMTQNKCCRHGANLRRRRRRRRKILHSIIFSCSIIAVAVFVAVGSSMIRSGDGRTNRYDVEAGYSVDGSGSSWTLISEGCMHYGVKAKAVALDESRMKAELDEGHPIVVNVGPGDFTDTGHFMVITGYDDEGFSINDPNSIEKSGKRWLFRNISSQIRAVWSMYV